MSRPLRILALGTAMSLAAFAAAPAATGTTQTAAPAAMAAVSDQQYVDMAAAGDAFEIASSKLALDRSDDDQIREFAQRMIDDHTAMSQSLASAAAQAGIEVGPVPTDDPKLATLQNAGDDFDSQYLALQLQAHQEALALHQGYAANGADAGLRQVAETAVPIVSSHLEHLQGWNGGTP